MATTFHICYNELNDLESNPPSGEFSYLIVGTFNAKIPRNNVSWYYERPQNEFWFLFPRILGIDSLHQLDNNLKSIDELILMRKEFCKSNKIIIVDIFKSVEREIKTHSDEELKDLIKNEYSEFEYKKAFHETRFKNVCFTWASDWEKEENGNKIRKNIIKKNWTNYFITKKSKVFQFQSPSPANNKYPSRFDKFKAWEEELNNKKNEY